MCLMLQLMQLKGEMYVRLWRRDVLMTPQVFLIEFHREQYIQSTLHLLFFSCYDVQSRLWTTLSSSLFTDLVLYVFNGCFLTKKSSNDISL